jgi:hypothetical protein
MGEIRNARCLLLQWQWNQYGDPRVDPIGRSLTGSITPIMTWILYADHQVDPMGRSLTRPPEQSQAAAICPERLPARTLLADRQLQTHTAERHVGSPNRQAQDCQILRQANAEAACL